jgi:hypothetical protein
MRTENRIKKAGRAVPCPPLIDQAKLRNELNFTSVPGAPGVMRPAFYLLCNLRTLPAFRLPLLIRPSPTKNLKSEIENFSIVARSYAKLREITRSYAKLREVTFNKPGLCRIFVFFLRLVVKRHCGL